MPIVTDELLDRVKSWLATIADGGAEPYYDNGTPTPNRLGLLQLLKDIERAAPESHKESAAEVPATVRPGDERSARANTANRLTTPPADPVAQYCPHAYTSPRLCPWCSQPADTFVAPPSDEPVAQQYEGIKKYLRGGYILDAPLALAALGAIEALQRQVAELIKERDQQERFKWKANKRADEAQAEVAELQQNYALIYDAEYKGRKKIEDLNDEIKQKHEKNSEIYGRLCKAEAQLAKVRHVVDEQAKNMGLWFDAKYVSEEYLQHELRRLHSVIEDSAKLGKDSDD